VNKLRNAPKSIWVTTLFIAFGALFNFSLGLLLSLSPETFPSIEVATTPEGSPIQLILITGVACIAVGFIYIWVIKELLNRSQFVIVVIYTLSAINILFGLFRLPLGFLTIALNLVTIYAVRTRSAKEWLNTSS
jgi:hypothetical protein